MRTLLNITVLVLSTLGSIAQTKITPQEYIEKYKDYAVIEMHRSGVPASITLAQGMLESSNGNSRLATQAMNHFGIKCKTNWKGGVIYADDDAPDECFRAYKTVLESYQDHSNFLRENWRYHTLFELKLTDYKGWARGLRKAGYATNPSYHTILINLIERHKLYEYDVAPMPEADPASETYNDIPVVYAEKGETAKSIAQENDLRAKHIYKYNDLQSGSDIKEGQLIYLKPKKRKGSTKFHTVNSGESMHSISQRYGIKLKHLYKKNRMEEGTEPKPGQKLYMRSKREKEDAVLLQSAEEKVVNKKIEDNFVNPHTIKIEKAGPIEKEEIDVPEFYIVQSGDNIYRISERFHVFEEDILKWNRLSSMSLRVGQKLYLNKRSADAHYTPENPAIEEPKVEEIKESPRYHVVEKGETLYRICKKYGITQDQVMKWNNMNGPSIYAGQKIQIAE